MREQLGKGLAFSGWETFAAEGRADGLRLLYNVRPDLILLELPVDGTEAWETFSRIRLFTECPLMLFADQIPIATYCPPNKYNALVLVGQFPTSIAIAIAELFCAQLSREPSESLTRECSVREPA